MTKEEFKKEPVWYETLLEQKTIDYIKNRYNSCVLARDSSVDEFWYFMYHNDDIQYGFWIKHTKIDNKYWVFSNHNGTHHIENFINYLNALANT